MKLMDRTKAARNEARRTTRDARRAIAGDGNRALEHEPLVEPSSMTCTE